MFVLPKLPQQFCETGICLSVEHIAEDLLEWVKHNQLLEGNAIVDSDGERMEIELTLNPYDDDESGRGAHLHIELRRVDMDDQLSLTTTLESILGLVSDFIRKTAGEEAFCVCRSRLYISRADIPEDGIIANLLHFKRRLYDTSFALTDASLRVEDDVFDSLRFRYNEEKDRVMAELWASQYITVSEEFFTEFAKLMETGVDCFVFDGLVREPSDVKE